MTGRLRIVPFLIYRLLVGVAKPWLRPVLPVSGTGLLLRKDLEAPLVPFHARVPVEIVIASEHEVEEAARLRDPDGGLTAIYRSRWRRGHKCFVAKNGSAVIASNWLIFRADIDVTDFTVVGDGEIVCNDAFTAPPWRGNAIHTALLYRMLEWAREAGYRAAYTHVGAANRRSWISHRRLGWEIALVFFRVRARWMENEWVWLSNTSSHPMRGIFSRSSRRGRATKDVEARRLLLHRYANRLQMSVPWVCSRESPAGRTDIFVIDPAWDRELAEAGPLIHTAVATTLARAPRRVDLRKPIEVTVLLGDDIMNSELHRIGWEHGACVPMLRFTEVPADFAIGRRRRGSTYLGGLAFARETIMDQAQTKQLSAARYLAAMVIHGILVLLGYLEGDESCSHLAHAIESELFPDGAAGDGAPTHA
jgi:ssRNA-specific RNase YbeY (16S rRNA maturation enzyme)/GNAT superfamily N-acetyltransferase